jgi:ectoine hydroxylase-related dioxygenase (phytanoyl-CoA dioxygenase family)
MLLTEQRVKAYETEGFIPKIQISDEAEATRFRKLFDELEAKEGRERCQIGLIDWHFDYQFIWELATHPTILDCIDSLIGPDVMLLATHFFCKYGPDEKKFVAWHQDVTYWGLEPPEAVTAWYAIDDSDLENGCMRVIPSTHRPGIREHGKSKQAGNLLSINQEVPVSEEEEKQAVDLILKSGEISIHHGTLVHGSLPNRSTRRRCGLTVRYVPPWIKQVEINSLGRAWSTILLRGENKEKNFADLPRPFPMPNGAI